MTTINLDNAITTLNATIAKVASGEKDKAEITGLSTLGLKPTEIVELLDVPEGVFVEADDESGIMTVTPHTEEAATDEIEEALDEIAVESETPASADSESAPSPEPDVTNTATDAPEETDVESDAPAQEPVTAPETPIEPPVTTAAAQPTLEDIVTARMKEIYPNLQSLPDSTKNIVATMNEFLVAMGPGVVIEPDTGAKWQRRLYGAMCAALESKTDWEISTEALLFILFTYRNTHFNLRLMMRFVERIRLDPKEHAALRALFHLFQTGADRASRRLVYKSIDLDKLNKSLKNSLQVERVNLIFRQ